MSITAQDVNNLRKLTGAGMMDCKKALSEANGNTEKAIAVLRKKGQKVSDARADRQTSEGIVLVKIASDNSSAILISLTCETDFVAKNEDFNALGQKILDLAFENNVSSLDELNNLTFGNENLTVNEKVTELIGKIGEKISIKHFELIKGNLVIPYIHANRKLGVLVALKYSEDSNVQLDSLLNAGKDVAMQVAAMNPIALNKQQVNAKIIQNELNIGKDKAIQEGKPAELAEKIAQGRLGKFYKENVLLEQSFVKDNKVSISKYLENITRGLTVSSYKRIAISTN